MKANGALWLHLTSDFKSASRVLFVVAGIVLTGCASKPVINPGEWTSVNLEASEAAPDLEKTQKSRRTRVVVFPPQDPPGVSPSVGLANVATGALEGVLGKGGVELIDRKLANKLGDELKLIEMKGESGGYGGPDVADYAITVALSNASWGSKFSEASSYRDKKGQAVNIPASHSHTGRATMTIKIYELPTLRLIESVSVDKTIDVPNQRGAAGTSDAAGLMRNATEAGIKEKQGDILNEFSPKGYVLERRRKDKDSIFRVMLGKQTGAKHGDKVQVLSLLKNSMPGNRVSYDEVVVAEGVMTNIIGDEASWVQIDDIKKADKVRKGDFVKVVHESGGSGLSGILEKVGLPSISR